MSGESLERYFRMIHDERHRRPSGRLWCPAADVYRTNDGWIVKVDLAGIRPAKIEITIDGPVLSIGGFFPLATLGGGVFHHSPRITIYRVLKKIQILPSQQN